MSDQAKRPFKRIEAHFFGTTDLSQPKEICELLDALESDPAFFPESADSEERGSIPYSRDKFMEKRVFGVIFGVKSCDATSAMVLFAHVALSSI